ncbi:Ig-like domain-containing protein [Duganella sp. sic0402]|uniref:RCC1 domain-containing protein n=1 Tax=Duganella sp. sic0402 TaxID=2854786 RepID=UPI001C48C79D|nr:Ig-like domain-containing protein [Duganella sp. sic0402]MBV7538089.1 Ig-like domain-containing protein [Duganella sp. sic0402]
MKNFKFSSLLLAPLFAVLAACGGGGGDDNKSSTPTPVTLKSIAVTGAQSPTMTVNATQQLTATGTYSDGSTKTMTGLTWATKSGAATVATIATSGLVTAKGVGKETITATSTTDSISGSYDLTVIAPWTQISSGGNQTVALKADGKLYSWGSNIQGQLGDGSSTSRNAPVTVSGNSTLWKQVAVGHQFVVAIRTDGTLWTWGYNKNGQLGDGTQNSSLVPKQIGTLKIWTAVAAGKSHVLALQTTTTTGTNPTSVSTLWAWGGNYAGQLGDGTLVDKLMPTKIGTASWNSVAAAGDHSLGIQATGQTLWGWGANESGQVGNGVASGSAVTAPVQIGSATWLSVAAGTAHSLGIRTDGSLYAWGVNASGQLGNSGTALQSAPVPVDTSTRWSQVAGGDTHSIGVRNDGTLWAWGSNANGQLGNGSTDSLFPVQIGTLQTWKSVSAGLEHTSALRADGTLWTWGSNTDGQLGNGNNTLSPVPVNVPY